MDSDAGIGDHGLKDSDWDDLLQRIELKNCTPIVGSGACNAGPPVPHRDDAKNRLWTFRYPVGPDLAQAWAEKLHYPLDDPARLERVAQFVAIEKDPLIPKEWIAKEFQTVSLPDFNFNNEPHRVLAELGLPVYLTSNCDDYLVRALRREWKDVRISICRWNDRFPPDAPAQDTDPAHRDRFKFCLVGDGAKPDTLKYSPADDDPNNPYKPTPANPLVYHFHGHIAWPPSLVVSEDDYFEFLLNLAKDELGDHSLIMPRIAESLGGGSLLFLGYKLSDWDFLVLFRYWAAKFRKQGGPKHLAVQLGPMSGGQGADAERVAHAARYLGNYFGTRDIKVYWGTCQEFVAELKQRRELKKTRA